MGFKYPRGTSLVCLGVVNRTLGQMMFVTHVKLHVERFMSKFQLSLPFVDLRVREIAVESTHHC